jgi:hypothetical protein
VGRRKIRVQPEVPGGAPARGALALVALGSAAMVFVAAETVLGLQQTAASAEVTAPTVFGPRFFRRQEPPVEASVEGLPELEEFLDSVASGDPRSVWQGTSFIAPGVLGLLLQDYLTPPETPVTGADVGRLPGGLGFVGRIDGALNASPDAATVLGPRWNGQPLPMVGASPGSLLALGFAARGGAPGDLSSELPTSDALAASALANPGAVVRTAPAKQVIEASPENPLALKLTVKRRQAGSGELIDVRVFASADCYVGLIRVDSSGAAGIPFRSPTPGRSFGCVLTPALGEGAEYLVAVASSHPLSTGDIPALLKASEQSLSAVETVVGGASPERAWTLAVAQAGSLGRAEAPWARHEWAVATHSAAVPPKGALAAKDGVPSEVPASAETGTTAVVSTPTEGVAATGAATESGTSTAKAAASDRSNPPDKPTSVSLPPAAATEPRPTALNSGKGPAEGSTVGDQPGLTAKRPTSPDRPASSATREPVAGKTPTDRDLSEPVTVPTAEPDSNGVTGAPKNDRLRHAPGPSVPSAPTGRAASARRVRRAKPTRNGRRKPAAEGSLLPGVPAP